MIKEIGEMIKDFKTLKQYIKADLFRYTTSSTVRAFLRAWFTPGFRFTFWMRMCQYFSNTKWNPIFLISFLILRHYSFKYGICIHYNTEIGPGLYIGHFGGIVVNPTAKIGKNVNLSPNILIGQDYKKDGSSFGYPVIGDRVFLANGCKVVGDTHVGNDAVVGLGAFVNKDIAEKAIAVGTPAKIISFDGSSKYVGSYIS